HLVEPREHPDDDRRYVKPPSWDKFGGRTQFATLRGFGVTEGKITGYIEALDQYTQTYRLGNVIWPSYPIVFAENLGDLADEIQRRGLFLFDLWGYVPGSGPGGYWQQYQTPPGVFPMLEGKLGDHWLGMDIGEQDGRYIGGYASQMMPVSGGRFEQYLNFQCHFEHMGNELGNRLSVLVSLNFGHHLLKEGTYATIGAETAQALPNGQVYYAFIRGAGKQYGVPWFGNASVWNRWGWKCFDSEGPDHGVTKGTSLNLLKRLMYSHILYNCVFVGFESGWIDSAGKLTTLGRIQQAAQEWVLEHGQPGVMVTPVALMTDFYAGWSFPRHLYTQDVYRVWGTLPYEEGDYLTDALLDMFYPGYQDASYFHDERGFIAATPYGDAADCLLSDAPGWLLDRYPVVVLAGEVNVDAELRDKLTAYTERGGCLVVTGANLAKFPEGLGGVRLAAGAGGLEAPPEARMQVSADGRIMFVESTVGRGRVVAFASAFGLEPNPEPGNIAENPVDGSLYKPKVIEASVREVLDRVFREQILFDAGPALSLIVCRKGADDYTVGVCNNTLTEQPLALTSLCGPIETLTELVLDQSEKGTPGYLPEGSADAALGSSSATTIAGGDVRIFAVRVREEGVAEIPHVAPPPRPKNRALPLRGQRSIQEEILSRPTFFEHFDGAVVDWRYVHDRDIAALEREAGWLGRQRLRLWVDFTSGINLYPGLRLIKNDEGPYAESMAVIGDVLAKMQAWGARDAILCLHRVPETNFSHDETWVSFEETLQTIAAQAAARDIRVYLRASAKEGASLQDVADLVKRVGAPNMRLAPSTALLTDTQIDVSGLASEIGAWIVGAPAYDAAGRRWTANAPLAGYESLGRLRELLSLAPEVPVLLDAVYPDQDAEYRDARVLDGFAN
ncbi:MAG: hypothetical protein QG656_2, partial [Candidatus Hydrogenedentes bacterium]|nr:hypothetical protein [Candidatus Hydrogenedentota bacterium]